MEEPQQDVNFNYPYSLQTSTTAVRDYDYVTNTPQQQQRNFKGVTILKSVYRSLIPSNRKNKKMLKRVSLYIIYIYL